MLDDDDLDAAVGASIVTQAQADALRTFAAGRRKFGAAERADEERFRFMRGFNDFFFAIGVVLFGAGLSLFAGTNASPIVYGVAAVVMWGLAELLVRRMRLVLPGIVIVIFFVAFVISAAPPADLLAAAPTPLLPSAASRFSFLNTFFGNSGLPQIIIKAVIAGAAGALFYARFRFPFALLLVAGGTVIAFELAISHFLFDDSAVARLLILLLCGVVVFGAAMWFDLSDRLRATRSSDCAFWLHVLAAPLLVHSMVGLVSSNAFRPDNFAAIMIIVIALLLTAVALIIDRRALLVSALVYVGSAIAFALSNAAVDRTFTLIATLVILGALVLALGVGWSPLRRRVVSVLAPKFVDRLPPVVPA
jgi:hypothetical protein